MPGYIEVPEGVRTIMIGVTNEIVNPIMGIIFAAALAYFLWGLMGFIFNADNESKRAEGKQHMVWGLIGMAVMVSVLGILQVALRTVGVDDDDIPYDIELEL